MMVQLLPVFNHDAIQAQAETQTSLCSLLELGSQLLTSCGHTIECIITLHPWWVLAMGIPILTYSALLMYTTTTAMTTTNNTLYLYSSFF